MAREHVGLQLAKVESVEIDFHDDGRRPLIGCEQRRCERVIRGAQHVDRAEQVDRVVRSVHFPEAVP